MNKEAVGQWEGRWGVGAGMEKVQSIVGGEEKKRTNTIYAYYVLDRILST